MKITKQWLLDGLYMIGVVLGTYFLNLVLQELFVTRTLIPMIFVLGVFLVSLRTQGYFWGITASLCSVLAVNYAFTYPYFAIDLISPECVSSAAVMLLVAICTGTLTTKIKVQEKIRTEIELERMRANLLRAVSHDLRTPLTSIYGASSTLIDNCESLSREQMRKHLEEIGHDAQGLIRMVENLLSITRIDGQNMQLTKAPAVLEELVDAVLLKFRKHFPGRTVEVDIPEEFIVIPMDAMLIQQVLLNLLENAVHHAAGMTWLRLQVRDLGEKVEFSVRDNGCGIPPERLRKLFVSYLDVSDKPVDSTRHNMGIGLNVCAAIIKVHGGEIRAANHPEGGAVFAFTLEKEKENEDGKQQV